MNPRARDSVDRGLARRLDTAAAVAVVLRLLHLWAVPVTVERDAAGYWRLASALLAGEGLSFDGEPTALRLPGYPAFVAAVRAGAGDHPEAVVAVQALLAGLNVVLVGHLAHRWAGARRPAVAALAAWAWALYPYGFVYSHRLITEVPSTTLLLAMAWAASSPSRWRGAGVGAFAAALVYVKPSFLLFLPCHFVYAALRNPRRRSLAATAAVSLAVFAVLYAPWPVRNQYVLGEPVLGATNFGQSMFNGIYGFGTLGHPWDYDAVEFGPNGASPEEVARREALLKGIQDLGELERNRALTRVSFQLIRDDPLHFARNAFLTIPRLWLRFPWEWPPTLRGLALSAMQAVYMTAAILGVLAWRRHRQRTGEAVRLSIFIEAVVIYTIGVHLPTTPVVRYSYPAMALLCVCVGQLVARFGRSEQP
jgi:hypothetical protein